MHDIVYSPQDKWVFIHIPKNGGTSFSEFLRRDRYRNRLNYNVDFLQTSVGELHNPAAYLKAKYVELRECRPICIVRNPWSRCLSLYTFNLENTVSEQNYKKSWAIGVHSRLTREGFKQSWMPGGFFRDERNMQLGIAHNPGRFWKENDSQLTWITPDAYTFKLENDMEKLYDFVKIPYNKTISNQSKHYDYRKYYDAELQSEIVNLYSEDIEAFGYSFDS